MHGPRRVGGVPVTTAQGPGDLPARASSFDVFSARLARAVAAETRKLATVWSTPVIVGIGMLLAGGLGLLVGFGPAQRTGLLPGVGTSGWFGNVFSAMDVSSYLGLILGIVVMTGEYRHQTATALFLAEPRRTTVLSAKMLAAIGAGVAVSVAAGFVDLVVGVVVLASGHGSAGAMLDQFGHVFLGDLIVTALYAVIGLGAGTVLRNQVAAIALCLGVLLVLDTVIDANVPAVGRWLPSAAAEAVENLRVSVGNGVSAHLADLVSPWVGAGVLLGYGVVLVVAGAFTSLRSDVT